MEEESVKLIEGAAAVTAPLTQLPAAQHAHGVVTNNGDVNLAGRDVIIHRHTHLYASPNVGIVAALRIVRNLRNIHLDILSKATPGTWVWLLQTDMFLLWLDSNGNLKILWGTGIPGAGKSVLASLVINELESRAGAAGGSVCVAYVYFRYSDASGLTVRAVLEILVKQTVERHPECASLAEDVYDRHLQENTQPTETELLQLLQRFTGTKSATFYILDALDEAPDKLQLELIKKLASLDVRLFITSRPLRNVENRLSDVYSFPIIAQEEDIELHINEEIERSADLEALLEKGAPSLREEVVSSIKKNCDGMFLHASLQLNALCECLSLGEVRRTLKAFPSNIEDVYLQTWDRISKRNPSRVLLAKTALVWVLNSARSMTLDELERAVATSPETHKFEPDEVVPGVALVSLCRGLITFEEESGVVRLVHYTAKTTVQRLLHDTFPYPQSHLAAVCMTHLTECGFQNTTLRSEEEFTAALQADPLLAYAFDAWATHVRESLDDADTRQRAEIFIQKCSAFPAYTSPNLSESFDILGSLHLLAIYNLPISLMTHGNLGNPNAPTEIYRESPLSLASWHGHEGTAASLLALSEIQVNFVDKGGWSALMLAASLGHEATAKLCLAHPKIEVCLIDKRGWSALIFAAANGHEDIVKLLFTRTEIQVNLADVKGRTALMFAANAGHGTTVQLLLDDPEIEVNLVDKQGWSALMFAAANAPESVIKPLLAYPNIQVNLVGNEGSSALTVATVHGHEGNVKLLLAHPEIRVNLFTSLGWSALMLAARHCHEGIIALLLAHPEILVNMVNNQGWSALMLAAFNRHEGAVCILLAHPEIEVNLVNDEGWSSLMAAASNGHEGVVKLLLAHPEIQVNLVDREGLSALMVAAFNGHDSIVASLLARPEILVNLVSKKGWSALMLTAFCGHQDIVGLLLDVPHINSTTKSPEDGHTAMSLAIARGHVGVVRLLQEFEIRQAGSDSEVSSFDNAVPLDRLSLPEAIDEDEMVGSDSEDSDSYKDAEEWLEEGDVYSV